MSVEEEDHVKVIHKRVYDDFMDIIKSVKITKKYKCLYNPSYSLSKTNDQKYYEVINSVYLAEIADLKWRELCMSKDNYYNLLCDAEILYEEYHKSQ